MKEAPKFELVGSLLIRRLSRLNKTLQQTPSMLGKLKYLASEISDNQSYTKCCESEYEKIKKALHLEKKFLPAPVSTPSPVPQPVKNPAVKKIKTFPDYLILPSQNGRLKKSQEKLAEICKNLFNTNNSPKDFAIMLCLLSEKGYILILNKQRTEFYTAWYKFIERPIPPRNNFCAINKYIDDKAAGFVFKDESDGDYRSLKNALHNLLKHNNL